MKIFCFFDFAKIDGKLGQPSEEIEDAEFVGDVGDYNISSTILTVIGCLKKDKHL